MFYVGIREPSGREKLEILATFILNVNIIRPFLMNWDSFAQDALEFEQIRGDQVKSSVAEREQGRIWHVIQAQHYGAGCCERRTVLARVAFAQATF